MVGVVTGVVEDEGGPSTSMLPRIPYSNPVVSDPNPKSVNEKLNSCDVSIKLLLLLPMCIYHRRGLVSVSRGKACVQHTVGRRKWHIVAGRVQLVVVVHGVGGRRAQLHLFAVVVRTCRC